MSDKGETMIESVSAITLATHDMGRAVKFYRALGFDVIRVGANTTFTSFRAGTGYLNLTAQPAHRRWSWWGRPSSMWPTWTLSAAAPSPRGWTPKRPPATRNGASATSTSPTRTGTNSASLGLWVPRRGSHNGCSKSSSGPRPVTVLWSQALTS